MGANPPWWARRQESTCLSLAAGAPCAWASTSQCRLASCSGCGILSVVWWLCRLASSVSWPRWRPFGLAICLLAPGGPSRNEKKKIMLVNWEQWEAITHNSGSELDPNQALEGLAGCAMLFRVMTALPEITIGRPLGKVETPHFFFFLATLETVKIFSRSLEGPHPEDRTRGRDPRVRALVQRVSRQPRAVLVSRLVEYSPCWKSRSGRPLTRDWRPRG